MARAKSSNGANLGFEQKLWQSADKLRNNMDAAEYKHVVLGLIFLKYISDAFSEVYRGLKADNWADFILIDVPSCKGWGYSDETLRGQKK